MTLLELIAEQKIAAAMERGEFAGLPGEGKPLDLTQDAHVPEDMRMAYRILRNAGLLPPEIERARDIAALEALLDCEMAGDPETGRRALAKLQLLRIAQAETRALRERYSAKLIARLGR